MYTSHPVQSYTVYHDHTFTSPPFSSLLCSLLPCKRTRTRNLVQRRRHGKHETFTEFWTCSCPHPKSLPLNKSLNQHRRCGAFAFTFGLSFSPHASLSTPIGQFRLLASNPRIRSWLRVTMRAPAAEQTRSGFEEVVSIDLDGMHPIVYLQG